MHICILSVAVNAQQPQLSPSEKSGRRIFQTRCAMCHVGQDPATELATDGERRPGTFGPLLSKAQAANDAAVRDKIRNGGPRMPGYKLTLSDDEITNVVAFLKTVERPLTRLAQPRAGE
jgi:mono/diheme cytochrome c family protein